MRPESQARFVEAIRLLSAPHGYLEDAAIRRAHLLPPRDIQLETTDGRRIELPLSDSVYRAAFAECLRSLLDARGETLLAVRVNHEPGAAGWHIDVESVERGIDALFLVGDPYALRANPYVSGRWRFAADDNGVWWPIAWIETSVTDVPQFGSGQAAIETEVRRVDNTERIEVAASIGPQTGAEQMPEMTPEELQTMVGTLIDEKLEASIDAIVAKVTEALKPTEAAAAEAAGEGAGGDGAKEEDEAEVAASADVIGAAIAKAIAPLQNEIKQLRSQAEVRASLSGPSGHVPPGPAGGVPSEFGDRCTYYRNQGMTAEQAFDAARNFKG